MRRAIVLAAALLVGALGGYVAGIAEGAWNTPPREEQPVEHRTIISGPAAWLARDGYVTPEPSTDTPTPSIASLWPPTPATDTPTPSTATEWPEQLTEEQVRLALTLAGVPADLHDQAVKVAFCESRWRRTAVGDHGAARGLFQIHVNPWWRYAGEDTANLDDPVAQARVMLAVYRYDLALGHEPWEQWARVCRP